MRRLIEGVHAAIMADTRRFYMKDWDAKERGGRKLYARIFNVGGTEIPVRITQENDAGTEWRVDRLGLPAWEPILRGRSFMSDVAAAQAVQAWWDALMSEFSTLSRNGMPLRRAIGMALVIADKVK